MNMKEHKPTIETIVNTTALALTAWGVIDIQQGRYNGYFALVFGMSLEYFKYWGRKKKLW